MTSEEKAWLLISRAVSGEITPEELKEMESIFVAQPQLRSDFENIKRIKLSSAADHSIDERRALERGLKKFDDEFAESEYAGHSLFNQRLEPLKRNSNKGWMIAASIITILGLGLLARRYTSGQVETEAPQTFFASYGKRIKATLPDGSVVWLNSGSTVKYAGYAASGKREITLNGEAYFDVKHDGAHPFIVHAGKLNVVVLGTAFNVKAYNTDAFIETTLIRGKVEILNDAKPGKPIVMYPNEKIRVNTNINTVNKVMLANKIAVPDSVASANNGLAKVLLPDESIDETAWVSNKLIFKKENFNELASQLERWFNVSIVFDNDKYKDIPLTGAFENEDINQVMQYLRLTAPFHYKITNNQIHIW
jgi:transmembrane sensor